MEVLDSSIANVALPHIAGSLGASQDEATWVLTSYLVSNAVILPASAYLTTFIGRKKFYMICVVLFGVSSMMCGLAPSLPILIFCRVLQGAGGGGPRAVRAGDSGGYVHARSSAGRPLRCMGWRSWCAPAIGPSLGGWITDNYDWRWIFFINVPIALLSLFLTNRLVEDPPHVKRGEVAESKKYGLKLDYFGSGCWRWALARWSFCWTRARRTTGLDRTCNCVLLLHVRGFADHADLLGAVPVEAVGNRPILNLTLFKRKTFAIPFVLMFVLGFSLYGTTVLIPQFVQTLLGYTAELAGFVISPGGMMHHADDADRRLS